MKNKKKKKKLRTEGVKKGVKSKTLEKKGVKRCESVKIKVRNKV